LPPLEFGDHRVDILRSLLREENCAHEIAQMALHVPTKIDPVGIRAFFGVSRTTPKPTATPGFTSRGCLSGIAMVACIAVTVGMLWWALH
jgi:hypothetical protein